MSAAEMLAEARKWLGTKGRPNLITRAYAARNGEVYLRAPWCQMSITEFARRSGNAAAVLPRGDRAYTIWHAEDGRRLGRWHAGTAANIRAYAFPGAIVFFDWGGRDGIPFIDHVGIVEKNLGDGRVVTIEGNTGDACKRRVRGPSVIAGFWNPDYSKESDMTGDAIYKANWEQDRMPVPYGSPTNKEWKPRSVLVDHGVQLRKILAAIEAQGATIKALAEALGQQDQAIDVDALVGRIRAEIERVTVRLDVDDQPQIP
ncbi:CHAP domain-containing protein [Nonomuraea polychroma]|uniref:CHAP domain-containing protein n=1 Tax=Nonomuraea polychroma TaxID=46176 RepID=UPI003D93CEB1